VSLQLQPRLGTSPLGEEWARSGEEGSPKRASGKPLKASVVISLKRGPTT